MRTRPAKRSQQKEEAVAQDKQEKAGQRKEIFKDLLPYMAVNMAMTLDISGDKVDTEFPPIPLHTVRSCMFEERKDIFHIRVRGPEGAIRDVWAKVNITDTKQMVKAFELEANVPLHTVCYARRRSASVRRRTPLRGNWLCSVWKWHQHPCKNVDDMLLEPHEKQ